MYYIVLQIRRMIVWLLSLSLGEELQLITVIYITLLEESQLITVICYTVRGVTTYYCYMLHH
jgi:hypothetical protein